MHAFWHLYKSALSETSTDPVSSVHVYKRIWTETDPRDVYFSALSVTALLTKQ